MFPGCALPEIEIQYEGVRVGFRNTENLLYGLLLVKFKLFSDKNVCTSQHTILSFKSFLYFILTLQLGSNMWSLCIRENPAIFGSQPDLYNYEILS